MKNVGRAIRSIRVMMNMTGEELAKKAGMRGYGNLTRIEKGVTDPNLKTLNNICKALGVPEYLVMFLGADEKDIDWENGIPERLSVELVKLMRKHVVKGTKEIRHKKGKTNG